MTNCTDGFKVFVFFFPQRIIMQVMEVQIFYASARRTAWPTLRISGALLGCVEPFPHSLPMLASDILLITLITKFLQLFCRNTISRNRLSFCCYSSNTERFSK